MPRRSDSACCNPIEARATCRRRYQTTAATPATAAATTRTSDSGSISTPLMSQRKDRSTRLNSLPPPKVSSLTTSGWPSGLDAFHAAVRLRPPQQAQERLGLRPVERDHVPAMVRRPGLPVLDHPQDAVPRPLLHRHELRHLRRGPRVLERPLKHGEAAVRDDGDLVRHLIQEGAVVAHDEQHARIGLQGGCHDLLALDVEVVRRLVKDEEVVVLGDELREGEARALPAAELADAAVDRVPPEPAAAQGAPRPSFRRGRIPHAADLFEERAREVELLRLLCEIPDLQVLAPEHGSRVRFLASDQDLEEGRLPGAVRTDEADLVAFRQLEVDVREEEAAAVGLRDALEAHDPRTRGARAEREAEGARGRWR